MLAAIIAVGGLAVAAATFIVGFWAASLSRRDVAVSGRDLSLTAYANAIQGGILDLKRNFADRPGIFYKQMELNPKMKEFIPDYMREDIPTFLAFADGMWRFSYVFSVMDRYKELGLLECEREGLDREMKLWLREVPGFHDVYHCHTMEIQAHNPAFLTYLIDEVYTPEFGKKHGCDEGSCEYKRKSEEGPVAKSACSVDVSDDP